MRLVLSHVATGAIFACSGLLLASCSSTACAEGEPSRLVFRQVTRPASAWRSADSVPAASQPEVTPSPPPASMVEQDVSTGLATKAPAVLVPLPATSRTRFIVPPLGERHAAIERADFSTRASLPNRAPIRPNPQSGFQRPAKPFESIQPEPTISPYLNLYREEDDAESVPNYFAFVRPQLEQLEENRTQQREMQQLRGQLQRMSSSAVQPYRSPTPGTGIPARYMDTAHFYSGWQQ